MGTEGISSKKTNWKRILLWVVLFFLFLGLFGKFVIVIDGETKKPIKNVTISYEVQHWASCSGGSSGKTAFLGIGYIRTGFSLWICDVDITADGYTSVEAGSFSKLPGIGPFRIVRLHTVADQEKAVFIQKTLYSGDGIDVLGRLGDHYDDISTPDIIFSNISDQDSRQGHIAGAVLEIQMNDSGGIKEVENSSYRFSSIKNIITAPESGYQKSAKIDQGKSYVIRLRDGKHYAKFILFSSKDLNGTQYVDISIYAQPQEKRGLSFEESDFLKDFSPQMYQKFKSSPPPSLEENFSLIGNLMANELNTHVDSLVFLGAKERTWADYCFELGPEFKNGAWYGCSMEAIDGYEITVKFDNKEHAFRVDEKGENIREVSNSYR